MINENKKYNRMSHFCTDTFKLIILVVLAGVCFHSAIVKFSPDTYSLLKPLTTNSGEMILPDSFADVSVCAKIASCQNCQNKSSLVDQCSKEFKQALTDATNKCSGYIKNLSKCRGGVNVRLSKCHIEMSNVEGCAIAVMQGTVDKWAAPEKVVLN